MKLFLSSALLIGTLYCYALPVEQSLPKGIKERVVSTEYSPKDYAYLYGMAGFSNDLLKMHFELYQGYVKNTNLLLNRLKELDPQTYEYGALKRRVGWEWNGMRLHELYFDNLGGKDPLDKFDPLYVQISKDFGTFDAWKKNFIATGLIRGIGWVVLYMDPQTGKLINTWINEHDLGHLSGGKPLLIMDVFEHAYITQYGLDRGKYINAFFENIEWSKVAERYTPKSP
jgi:superoxide dismutase, Fe-Mn family